jgi:hypothetical protein
VVTIEVAQPNQKPQKTSSYAYHMCGLNEHKMTNCPKFSKMRKTFHGKFATIAKIQPITKI